MTFDARRSTGSRRLGGEATAGDSGTRCGADVSRAPLNADSDTTLSSEVCCIVCFEGTCVFNCTINEYIKRSNFIMRTVTRVSK